MLPRKLAVEATADNVNTMRMNDKANAGKAPLPREKARPWRPPRTLRELTVTVAAKGGGAGRLFGSVTNSGDRRCAEAAATGIELDKTEDRPSTSPSRTSGTYTVTLQAGL